jgi:hypothetical protein
MSAPAYSRVHADALGCTCTIHRVDIPTDNKVKSRKESAHRIEAGFGLLAEGRTRLHRKRSTAELRDALSQHKPVHPRVLQVQFTQQVWRRVPHNRADHACFVAVCERSVERARLPHTRMHMSMCQSKKTYSLRGAPFL